MGLLTGLLTLPLAPARGVLWVAEQMADEAERQLYDEDQIRAELLMLEAEGDNLSPADRREREDALMERLAIGRARRAAGAGAWNVNQLEGRDPYG